MRIRRLSIAAVAALGAWAAPGGATAGAASRPAQCRSVKTDRFYNLSSHGRFGAFSITVSGTSCAKSRPIARKYVRDPFSVDSPKHRTKRVDGWSCTWSSAGKVSQEVAVTCTKSGSRIRFKDRLPNG